MALAKTIKNLRTAHENLYWRLTAVSIDAGTGTVLIVLSGYASAEARLAGHQSDDRRDWVLSGPACAAIASAAAQGATTYDVIAHACYSVIKDQRRPIPEGTTRAENGDLTLPTGEVVAAADVDDTVAPPTIPSEFADAQDV